MANRIRIPNPRLSEGEVTYLDADYTSGTDLTVQRANIFQNDDIAVVGRVGEERTESESVASTTGNVTVTLDAALTFDHNKGTAVYLSRWDQILIERQITSVGTWSTIITIDIQWDKLESLYDDTNGSDLHSYRFRFYNSAGQYYSDYSPTIAGSGFSRLSAGSMVLNVRKNLRDPNKERVKDSKIIKELNDGQIFITGLRHDWWFLKVDTWELKKRSLATGISTVAGQNYYDLDAYSNLNYLHRIRYHYEPSSTNRLYELELKGEEDFARYEQDQDQTNEDAVLYFKQVPPDSNSLIGYFTVWPTPSTATGIFYPIYFKNMGTLDTIDDVTPIPFPQILEDYASWQIHEELGNETQAKKYKEQFFGSPVRGLSPNVVTGVALLEQHQKRRAYPTGKGRSLWRPGVSNYSGYGSLNSDQLKERYF